MPAASPPASPRSRRPSPAGDVPVPATRLIGRERELRAASAQLRAGRTRLLTLTGPPGVGKTRLAIEAARTVAPAFEHGVAFVPLADVPDAALVPAAIARTLGIREQGVRPLGERLEGALRELELLVVLDNLEHLLGSGPFAARLLATCPRLKILVTSRAALHVSGEQESPLEPLETPDPADLPPAAALVRNPAVALFEERARAVSPEFRITEANARAVAEICAKLDGIPLAIELAAARVKLLAPQAMLERLARPLDLLTAGPRDLPARQQTLRGTIAWSVDLLGEEETRLLARIAVFAGGCTPAQVEELVRALGEDDAGVLANLAVLLDHSLLRRLESERGEVRLSMLETIRELALERLRASGEEEAVRSAHASMLVSLVEQAEATFGSPEEDVWLERLEAEQDNARAALRWCIEAGDERALRLVAAFWRFWLWHGYLTEGRSWIERALAPGRGGDSRVRARALNGGAMLAFYQADYKRGAALAGDGLGLAREASDDRTAALATTTIALLRRTRGDLEGSRALYQEALETFRRLGDDRRVAYALERLGNLDWFEGRYDEARSLLEESIAVSRQAGDAFGVAAALQELGWVALGAGEDARARALHEESTAAFRRVGDRWRLGRGLLALALLSTSQGDHPGADARLAEALALFEDLGDRLLLSGCLVAGGALAAADRRPRDACRLLAAADALREGIGARWPAVIGDRYWDARTAAEAELEPAAAALLQDEGGAWTIEQAIERASGQTTPRTARPAGLTDREVDVLRLVADGLTDADVAETLVLSVRTVNAHLRSIYRKLDVSSRSAATRFALEHGLADAD